MDSSRYREALIGLDRALFVFHEAAGTTTAQDRNIEAAIASIRREILRTWASEPPFPVEALPGEASATPATPPPTTP